MIEGTVLAVDNDHMFDWRGRGLVIISTSRGLMTDKDARREQIGGELLCEVW